MQNEVLAYLAGLFDGEGNAGVVSIQRKFYPNAKKKKRAPQHVPYLQLKMTDKECVEIIYQCFGGCFFGYDQANPKHKRVWGWRVSHRKAENAAQQLLPFSRNPAKIAQLTAVVNHYKETL